MLRSRLIPCLLVHDQGLTKTVRFSDHKYVGDPINAVKIFNEKVVDELIVLDIDATVENKSPDFKMIKNLAVESRMPLCYGGGIKTAEQASRIVGLGVEKIAISSAAIGNPELIKQVSDQIGSQSVVVVLDVKKKWLAGYRLVTHNGKKQTDLCPIEFAQKIAALGCGEIVINSVDRDGTMRGYDLDLAKSIYEAVRVPVTLLGGVGNIEHIKEAFGMFDIIGAAAGSFFVFKGVHRAVLINYPSEADREILKV